MKSRVAREAREQERQDGVRRAGAPGGTAAPESVALAPDAAGPASQRVPRVLAAGGPPAGAPASALGAALALQRAYGNLAVRSVLQGATLQRDHHMRSNPKRKSVNYGQLANMLEDVDMYADTEDYDYDDLADGWEFPDDHTYGEPKQVWPWSRPGFSKETKKYILKRDLGTKCALCGQKLTPGTSYTTKKGKTKIDNLDIDHYSSDWIVRVGKVKNHYNLNPANNQTVRDSVTEAYNDHSNSATIKGAGGYLRLTHAPCNRSRSKSYS